MLGNLRKGINLITYRMDYYLLQMNDTHTTSEQEIGNESN
jgi:hypothetical protein